MMPPFSWLSEQSWLVMSLKSDGPSHLQELKLWYFKAYYIYLYISLYECA